MSRYMPVAEVATHVRAALKAAFPKVKFSVRSKSYSGGASIRVGWTDGPPVHLVDAVVEKFRGADFDGMIDLKTHRDDITINGESVSLGADFIFTERSFSVRANGLLADKARERYGLDLVFESGYPNKYRETDAYVEHEDRVRVSGLRSALYVLPSGAVAWLKEAR